MPITDIITTIVKPSAAGTIYNGTPVEQLPITLFVADLVTRMGWDPNQFSVYRDCGNLVFGVGNRERNHFCCIQDVRPHMPEELASGLGPVLLGDPLNFTTARVWASGRILALVMPCLRRDEEDFTISDIKDFMAPFVKV